MPPNVLRNLNTLMMFIMTMLLGWSGYTLSSLDKQVALLVQSNVALQTQQMKMLADMAAMDREIKQNQITIEVLRDRIESGRLK